MLWNSSPPRRTQPSPSPRRNWRNYVNSIKIQLTDLLRVLDLEPGVPPPRESDVPKIPHHQTAPPSPSTTSTPPNRSSSPLRRTQPSPYTLCNRRNYENNIKSQLTDSLRILGLEPGFPGREINVRYRFLARQLHPDKHDPEITGMTSEEAVEQFKRVNNAQQFIRDSM